MILRKILKDKVIFFDGVGEGRAKGYDFVRAGEGFIV
jgi:hypothetical protein